jgi:RES domain-containing protein
MKLWRICKTKYAKTALDGLGGTFSGARWHVRGTRIVYTSTTPSLAALECLVYMDPSEVPSLTLLEIDIPKTASVEYCEPEALTPNWREFPHRGELQEFGSTWVQEARSLLLRVPSAVMNIDVEWNFLMNPAHIEAHGIRIASARPFSFDARLL